MININNHKIDSVTMEYVTLWYIYILAKGKIYNMLSISITAVVLKRLNFSCPTNKKIDACMRQEKVFQNSSKIK